MGKSWREPSKGVWGKVKGPDRRKEDIRKNDDRARQEIRQITRRTGEKVEMYLE